MENNALFQSVMSDWMQLNASDLHIKAPNPPFVRLHGELVPMPGHSPLTEQQVEACTLQLLGKTNYDKFWQDCELDVALNWGDERIRVNAHMQQGGIGLALRLLPSRFIAVEELGLPCEVTDAICGLKQGLVLVTGATGSGKSTTLASLINRINSRYARHIITVEDPVEYRHYSKKSLITQREIGTDTASFGEALRRILREDPDVVLIGEMRDRETMSAALTLAETGHLTMATLHTSNAVQTVTRIISSFPANEQEEVRTQLAMVLRYVISQHLLPWRNGKGRSLAAEILVMNPAIRSMIRDNKLQQILGMLQTGGKQHMRTMNMALRQLVQQGDVDEKTAIQYSSDVEEFKRSR